MEQEVQKREQKKVLLLHKNIKMRIALCEKEGNIVSEIKKYIHIRKVDWQNIGEWEHPGGQAVMKTLTNITPYNDYVQNLNDLFLIESSKRREFLD